MQKRIIHDHNRDGIDRRGFLTCMAWAGTGVIWTVGGGVLSSRALGETAAPGEEGMTFVQISDSHIGFSRPANPNVNATFERAVQKINLLADRPEFILHTGDMTHNSRPEEFDTLDQLLTQAKPNQVFYVPGEHDILADDGKTYLDRYGRGTAGRGWHSFDSKGVHFLGLVNVGRGEGMGKLGADQLDWIEDDLKGRPASTPIVVFAHVPLWTVYPEWGWGTEDSAQVLAYLKRFGSVTVLNGHIHQVMQKTEGNVTFHTAMSTAFPQPAPGTAPSPGPMQVPAERLRGVLGITNVKYVVNNHGLAIVDARLES